MNNFFRFIKKAPIFIISMVLLVLFLYSKIYNITNSDGRLVKNEFGYRYFVDRQNEMIKNKEIKYNNKSIYIDQYGEKVRNAFRDDIYYDEKGYKLTNSFYNVSGSTIFFDENGNVVYDKWINIDGKNYYADQYGCILKDMWINDTYYVDTDGVLLTDCTTPDGSHVDNRGKYKFTNYYNLDPSNIKVGDIIKFGQYTQSLDQNSNYKNEDIEWIVLENDNGKIKLLSKYILDNDEYNHKSIDINWRDSSLREWLNSEFLRIAFSRNDIDMIIPYYNQNLGNSIYNINEDTDTLDKVFIPSKEDIRNHFGIGVVATGINEDIKAKATDYAMRDTLYVEDGIGNYWLRNQGFNPTFAMNVQYTGVIDNQGVSVCAKNIGIRPCICIDLNKE